VDYNFVDEETFFSLYKNGEIFEYTRTYSDSYYGSPRALLETDDSAALVVELDPLGFTRVRATSKRRVIGIFVTIASEDELRSRIASRSHIPDTSQRLRIRTSQQTWAWVYDYVLVNDERTEFLSDLATVAKSEIIKSKGAQYLAATQHQYDPTLHREESNDI